VDYALTVDILPSTLQFGKDLGVFYFSITLPQILGPILAGLLLDAFNKLGAAHDLPQLGYTIIFSLSIICFIISAILIIPISFENRFRGLDEYFFSKDTQELYPVEHRKEYSTNMTQTPYKRTEEEGRGNTQIQFIESDSEDSYDEEKALNDFVGGKIGVDDLSFGSDLSDEEN